MVKQLTFELRLPPPTYARRDFVVAPGNREALAWIDRWPDWPAPALALGGPAGCGKTHLSRIWAERAKAPVIEGHELYVRTRNGRFDLHWVDPFGGETEEQVGEDKIAAPLPGTVVALLAEEGAMLEKGAPILTLEVMKMEQTLRAPFAGRLTAIKCKVGDIVQEGVELAEVEPVGS